MPFVSEWDVKALFNRSTIYIAPLPEGAPWRCRLGCEHDTLRLLLLRPHAGTQPIRPIFTILFILILQRKAWILVVLVGAVGTAHQGIVLPTTMTTRWGDWRDSSWLQYSKSLVPSAFIFDNSVALVRLRMKIKTSWTLSSVSVGFLIDVNIWWLS